MSAEHFSNATTRGGNTHDGTKACHRGDCGILGNGTTGSHSSGGVGVFGGSIHVGELLEAAPPIRHALELKLFAHQYYYCRASATTNEACFRWPTICCDGYASAGRSTDTGSNAPLWWSEPSCVGSLLAADRLTAAKLLPKLRRGPARKVRAFPKRLQRV